MLFDQWPGMTYLPLPSAVHAQRIYAASRYLEDFVALDPPFFPPLNVLLRGFHIQLRALRDVAAEMVDTYDERYLDQGTMSRRSLLRSAFLCARRVVDRSGGSPLAANFEVLTKKVARQADVCLEDAAMLLRGVEMIRETQIAERIEKYGSELPLRAALDWFLERRRFC
jgi:hypothetical protein